jgi:hypothetical protein
VLPVSPKMSGAQKSYVLFLAEVFPENCPDEQTVLEEVQFDLNTSEVHRAHDAQPPDDQESEEIQVPPSPRGLQNSAPHDNFSDQNSDQDSSSDSDDESPNLFIDQSTPSDAEFQLLNSFEDPMGELGTPGDYDDLPEYFVNVRHWPKSTNRICWLCTLKIPGPPWFIPTAMTRKILRDIYPEVYPTDPADATDSTDSTDPTDEVTAYQTHGCYCGPLCVRRYLNRVKDQHITNSWECLKLLYLVASEIFGYEISEIPEAEDPTVMIQFCGSQRGITPQEYRLRNELRLAVVLERLAK